MVLEFAQQGHDRRVLLTTTARTVGPMQLDVLTLEVPRFAFPFDISEGAQRFRNDRCILRQCNVSLAHHALTELLKQHSPITTVTRRQNKKLSGELSQLRCSLHQGWLEVGGLCTLQDATVPFTCRMALLPRTNGDVHAVLYHARLYGLLPVPAAVIPAWLLEHFAGLVCEGSTESVWIVRPVRPILRQVLPRAGWKIPDLHGAPYVTTGITPEKLWMAYSEAAVTHTPVCIPEEAITTAEGLVRWGHAEAALQRGAFVKAYGLYRKALDAGCAHDFIHVRLLQLGAIDPAREQDTVALAERLLKQQPSHVDAQLALATMASRQGDYTKARRYFDQVSAFAHQSGWECTQFATQHTLSQLPAVTTPEDVITAAEQALRTRPHDRSTRQKLAWVLWQHHRWERLLQLYDDVARTSSDPEEIREATLFASRIARDKLSDTAGARARLEILLALQSYDEEILSLIAPILQEAGDTDILHRHYEKAAATTNDMPQRAEWLYQAALTTETNRIALLKAAIETDPRHRGAAEAWMHICLEQYDAAQLEAGITQLIKAIPDANERGHILARHISDLPDLSAAETVRRVLFALIQVQDLHGAVQTCTHLAKTPRDRTLAHRFLARWYETRGEWPQALAYMCAWLLDDQESKQQPPANAAMRQHYYVRAAQMALEIDPAQHNALMNACAIEFPTLIESMRSTLETPWGAVLRQQQQWDNLLRLRLWQLKDTSVDHRFEIAELLHHHLHRSVDALPYYYDVLGNDPLRLDIVDTVRGILLGAQRWQELAMLLFQMSQLLPANENTSHSPATLAAEASAIYSTHLNDPERAASVLQALSTRADHHASDAPHTAALPSSSDPSSSPEGVLPSESERQYQRRLADLCTTEQRDYPKALALYQDLLAQGELHPDLLRILGRITSHLKRPALAYGYYAALLTLVPHDDEAGRFVGTCRAQRPQPALTAKKSKISPLPPLPVISTGMHHHILDALWSTVNHDVAPSTSYVSTASDPLFLKAWTHTLAAHGYSQLPGNDAAALSTVMTAWCNAFLAPTPVALPPEKELLRQHAQRFLTHIQRNDIAAWRTACLVTALQQTMRQTGCDLEEVFHMWSQFWTSPEDTAMLHNTSTDQLIHAHPGARALMRAVLKPDFLENSVMTSA